MQNILETYSISNPKINQLLQLSDFHIHTQFSDGSIDPFTLIDQIGKTNLQYISITDHNGIDCYTEELLHYATKKNLFILPGTEIDCGSGLDILVYDSEFGKISSSFKECMTALTKEENKERLMVAEQALNNIIGHIEKYQNKYPWINYQQKKQIYESLTVNNLQKINLKTGELNISPRSYVSKPHIIKLLDSLDLINWDIFITMYTKDKPNKKEKVLTKIIFSEFTTWKYDEEKINQKLLSHIQQSGFISILAHPGKTFYDIYPDIATPSEKQFQTFVKDIITHYGIRGAEGEYRSYHDTKLPYNELTQQVLEEVQKNSRNNLYLTAGSDSHHGIITTA